MPYDAYLADRVRSVLARRRGLSERRMFGGLAFLRYGHLLAAIWGDGLIVRLGADAAPAARAEPHVEEFLVGGKPFRGWVFVTPDGLPDEASLLAWLDRGWNFVGTLPAK